MNDWKQKALTMKVDEGKSWMEVYAAFPDISQSTLRHWITRQTKYKAQKRNQQAEDFNRSSIEYKQDGSIISEKFITIRDADDITPEFILEAHGLNPALWEVVSYKNNLWNTQVEGGAKQISYQSKLTAKPKVDAFDLSYIDNYLETKQFKYSKPLTNPLQYDINGEILEICLPDLHSGLLAWRKETGEDYDVHIAKDHFFKCLYDILDRCTGRKFKQIIFVTLGDVMHFDNDNQTTTKGTFQQADGRLAKIFDATLDMLIDGITLLGAMAPVEVVYLCGNHDRVMGYALLKAVEKAFRNDDNIIFDTEPNPQKHKLVGNILLGWTHGDMPNKNMGGWLQQSARKEYGQSLFAEVHAGHFHSQKVNEYKQTYEDSGVVVRFLPTICNASYWEHQQGYNSPTKALMCFVWNDTTGLREMWYSNI